MKDVLKESLDIIASMSQTTRNHSMKVILDPVFPLRVNHDSVSLEFTSRKNLVNFINCTEDYLDYMSAKLGKETFDKQLKDQVQLLASLKRKLEKIDEQCNHPY